MKRVATALLPLMLSVAPAFAQAGWEALAGSATGGGVSNSPGNMTGIRMALDPSGHPVVGWAMEGIPSQIFIRRWDGSSWVAVAGAPACNGDHFDLAVDPAGDILVAYSATIPVPGTNSEVRLQKYAGGSWSGLGDSALPQGISNTSQWSDNPVMALDASGKPVVAWLDPTSSAWQIYLRRWTGATWEELAGSGSGGGGVGGVSRINGGIGFGSQASVRVDASGHPVVAWSQQTAGAHEIYLKRWTGAAWIEEGGSASGGGISANAGDSIQPSVAIDGSGNPGVAWRDDTNGNPEIYVRLWNGGSWMDQAGSGSGGGISASENGSWSPSMALDAGGGLMVAWMEQTPTAGQIHLRRWSGTAWDEVAGSAGPGGISGSALGASAPALAATPDGLIAAAWLESAGAGWEEAFYKQCELAPVIGPLEQLRPDGATPIPQGGTIAEATGIVMRSPLSSFFGVPLRLQVEVREAGDPFTGLDADIIEGDLVASGSVATIEVSGLAIDRNYHWRARGYDEMNVKSRWISFGANPENDAETDFRLRSNVAPSAASAGQYDPSGALVAVGERFFSADGARFQAVVLDDDVDAVELLIEVRPVGVEFGGQPTASSELEPDGGTAAVHIPLVNGLYHWQYCTRDLWGRASAWTSFGGNDEVSPDFALIGMGSFNEGCANSSPGSAPAWIAVAMTIAALRLRRGRGSPAGSRDQAWPGGRAGTSGGTSGDP